MGSRGPKPAGGTTPPFNFRLPLDLRRALEDAAEAAGRTLSNEIIIRLKRTFTEDEKVSDAFGSRRNYLVMRLAGMALEKSDNWLDDPDAFDRSLQTVIAVLEAMRPTSSSNEEREAPQTSLSDNLWAGLYADALWDIVQRAEPMRPLGEGSRLDHVAALVKTELGHIARRPDPLARSRNEARRMLKHAFPTEDFVNMSDEELFARKEALLGEWHSLWERLSATFPLLLGSHYDEKEDRNGNDS